MSALRQQISRLLRGAAGAAASGAHRRNVVGMPVRSQSAPLYEVRIVSHDARGRRIVERWMEPGAAPRGALSFFD